MCYLPETNITPKIKGWKMKFLLGWPSFGGYVGFREGNLKANFKSGNAKLGPA